MRSVIKYDRKSKTLWFRLKGWFKVPQRTGGKVSKRVIRDRLLETFERHKPTDTKTLKELEEAVKKLGRKHGGDGP